MIEWLLKGMGAGYGLAIPVGAIAVLIIETAMRRGLRVGLAAGAGTATTDFIYASLITLFGTVIADLIRPVQLPLRAASVALLVFIAVRGLMALRRARLRPAPPADEDAQAADAAAAVSHPSGVSLGEMARTYGRFIGLTAVNPATVAYFVAFILGFGGLTSAPGERAAFVIGVGSSSLSWQWLLAVVGAVLHHRLPERFRSLTSVVGNLVILGLAGLMAVNLFQSI